MSQFCLKWNNHVPNLLGVFENLKSMETLVDVTLTCEGRIVKAHKLVLSAGSKFFQNLFLSNPCTHPVIIMHDMKYIVLKSIIEFMYRGEISVAQEHLEMLLKTAKTLDVKGLAEISNENTSAQNSELPNSFAPEKIVSPVQPAGSIQQARRKRVRSRKRSCDSTYSNDDVIPVKIKDPLSPEVQDLCESPERGYIDNEEPTFEVTTPVQQISSITVPHANSVVMSPSEDLNEKEYVIEDECHVESAKLQKQSNSQSPKELIRNNETSDTMDTSIHNTNLPTDSLSSSQIIDPNDSEDGDIVDMKPHFLRFYQGHEAQRCSLTEYLNDSDLCTVFQRCRNPSQFAVNIARMLFTPDELRESNCRGVKDKSALDRKRLQFIRTSVMKFYNILPVYETDIWKQCMQSIDSRCRHERRPKFRNAVISFGFSEDN